METDRSPDARYTQVAIAFHWILTVLILLNFVFVWVAEDASKETEAQLVGYHMANGMLILLLTVLRIIWRVMNPPPPFEDSLKSWEVALAKVVHAVFYFLMIAIPLVGWIMVSAFSGGHGVGFFGLFEIPGLPMAKSEETAGVLHEVHELFAGLMILLLGLHVAAALKHQFVDRDGTMRRMLSGKS
ncbi:MAG: cytochrome b [Novosphingobium sp.]|nr:cytochrome b [Novosphingobium sp.]MCP5402713.1 cytochrome b [Novosphingobium sp.]